MDGGMSWKCRILSIRRWRKGCLPRVPGSPIRWARVRWFYHPETVGEDNLLLPEDRYPEWVSSLLGIDVHDIDLCKYIIRQWHALARLGNTELLYSNEESIIPVCWIEGMLCSLRMGQ